MHITYIGLGKMGMNMVERLIEKGHTVTAYDPDQENRTKAKEKGASVSESIATLLEQDTSPRIIWLMVPHHVVSEVLTELEHHLTSGDTIIDGGNSRFKDTIVHARRFEDLGINFVDAGVSGGPAGARLGACIMVGGTKKVFQTLEPLFSDLSRENGCAYVGEHGAGHFVKMVHNGIEYGMMQALAEGFDVLRNAPFKEALSLTEIARLYEHGSVIESRLVSWLSDGLLKYGEDLEHVTGTASASGEGLWTVETAKELSIETPVIEDALRVREQTKERPSYQGKLISVMRNQFGGHSIEPKL